MSRDWKVCQLLLWGWGKNRKPDHLFLHPSSPFLGVQPQASDLASQGLRFLITTGINHQSLPLGESQSESGRRTDESGLLR